MISLWVMEDRPFGAERPMVAAMLRAVRAQGGDPPLRVHSLAWSRAWSRVRDALREDALPDVLEVGTTWLPALLALGVLIPSPTETKHRPRWPQTPGAEQRYTVPWTWDVRYLYYWRDELERIGMEPSQLGTLAGLREASRRVRDGGRREALAICGRPEPSLVHNAAPWIWAEGGDLLGTAHGGGLTPGGAGFRGLETLMTWARERFIAPSALDLGTVDVFDRFAAGDFAFLLAPALGMPWSNLGRPEISILPVPVGRSERTTFSGGSYLVVTRCAVDPELAWSALDQIARDTRPAMAAHHLANRRLIGEACREAQLDTTTHRFMRDRLHDMPHVPSWASAENLLADALSDWLNRARRGRVGDLAGEAGTLTADLVRQAAL